MIILEKGHIYKLDTLDGDLDVILTFVNREDNPHAGTQTQEVIRALIDRTMHCNSCLPWNGNIDIIHHLRMALVLHEARALQRKTEKGIILPERILKDKDGHFMLRKDNLP